MNRPKMIVYGGVSLDARLTIAPDVLLLFGDKRWSAIAEPSNVYEWLLLTHKPQALLEGSNSFIQGDSVPEPLPPVTGDPSELYQDFLPDAVIHHPAQYLWFTVVDSRGRVRWLYTGEPDKQVPGAEGQHLLVLVARQTPAEYLAYLQREHVPYLVAGDEQVDLHEALEKMASLLGIQCVIATSPGKLGGALVRAGLVDEVNIEFLPAIIGGTETPTLFDSPSLKPDELPTRLKLLAAHTQADGHVWLRYEVVRY